MKSRRFKTGLFLSTCQALVELEVLDPATGLLYIIELTPEQVNLLADLTCWGVLENAGVFQDLLAH